MKKRKTVRFLLLNSQKKLLLMRVVDPTTTGIDKNGRDAFWCTPGGSMEANETVEETIARELFEETGLHINEVNVGPFVWYGKHKMIIRNQETELDEQFIVLHTVKDELSTANFTDEEKKVVTNLSWLSYDEILNHHEVIFPVILRTHLPDIIAGNFPTRPIEVNLSLLHENT